MILNPWRTNREKDRMLALALGRIDELKQERNELKAALARVREDRDKMRARFGYEGLPDEPVFRLFMDDPRLWLEEIP